MFLVAEIAVIISVLAIVDLSMESRTNVGNGCKV